MAIRRRAIVAAPRTTRSRASATVVGLTPGNSRSDAVTTAIAARLPRPTTTSRAGTLTRHGHVSSILPSDAARRRGAPDCAVHRAIARESRKKVISTAASGAQCVRRRSHNEGIAKFASITSKRYGGPTRASRSMGRIHLAEARRAKADGRGLQPRARQLTPSAIGAFRGRRIVPVPAQARARGRAHPFAPGSSRAPVPCHWAGGALVGCALVGRLRDRGDPPRAARRRYRRAEPGDADRRRDRHHTGHRRLLVSADDPRLSQRRRRLHRREREPRDAGPAW